MNKDGQITLQELENAMNKCGVHPTKVRVQGIGISLSCSNGFLKVGTADHHEPDGQR